MTTSAEYARRYTTELGWSLVAIPAGRKGPTTLNWQQPDRALSSPDAAVTYYERNPTHNMGLLHSASGTVALDVDNVEHTRFIFAQLGIDYDAIMASAPRIVGRSGRGKALFKAPPGINSTHKIAWPVKGQPGKTEVMFELRAGAVQDVLPPSIHPDTGNPYTWDGPSVFNGLPELPESLRIIWENWDRFRPQFLDMCPWAQKKEFFRPPRQRPKNETTSVIHQFNAANRLEDLLVQYGYKQVAQNRYLSPNSGSGLAGCIIFDDGNGYSHHASDPFDNAHSFDCFELFAQYEFSGDISKAVRAAAERLNIVSDPEYVYDPEAQSLGETAYESMKKKTSKPTGPLSKVPEHLLSVPGVLQDVVNYYTTTAAKDQPQFAVQTALAFGSIVMGRRWVTDQRNYSGLYFINVGASATGKEHAKTVIERLLEDAGLEKRIGPSGYTSSSGVMSALLGQPTHIAIIDELGRVLQSSKASGNYHKADAQTILMEVFGRQDSTLRPQGFSKMGMRKEDAAELDKIVRRPSLTLMAMTTPTTLYDSISSKYVTDGFLGRFLIVESPIGRAPSRMRRQSPPSERLINWAKMCAAATTSSDIMDVDTADLPPAPIEIAFSEECGPILYAFDERMMRSMDEVERFGIEAMYGRTKEIAQRVALIVAVSKGEAEISTESLQWALDYVGHYAEATIAALKKSMADSPFEAASKAVYAKIAAAGLKGITESQLAESIRPFSSLKPMDRKAIFENLAADHGIQGRNLNEGKKGRPKIAWFAPAED